LSVILFISKIFMPTSKYRTFTFRKLYFLLAAFAGLLGTLICVSIFFHTWLSHLIIADEEYVYSDRRYYEVEECQRTMDKNNTRVHEIDKDKIASCEERKKKIILLGRSVDYKDNVLSAGIWGFLFIILFATHFPLFLKTTRKENW